MIKLYMTKSFLLILNIRLISQLIVNKVDYFISNLILHYKKILTKNYRSSKIAEIINQVVKN